jgi:predicted kinase
VREPGRCAVLPETYLAISGDRPPASLVSHYLAYRAFVRAKVACLPGAAEGSAPQADPLLRLAHRHLHEAQVALVLAGGSPGTGKSTLARAVAGMLGCPVLSSDEVRKELAGVVPTESLAAPLHEGLYSGAWTQRTYAELLRRADRHLRRGTSVVLDATWADDRHRDEAIRLAQATSSDLGQFVCELPKERVVERVGSRSGSASDADQRIAVQVAGRFHPWPGAVVVDTCQPAAAAAAGALHRLQPWRGSHPPVRPRVAAG